MKLFIFFFFFFLVLVTNSIAQSNNINCHQLAFRQQCGDLVCGFKNTAVPSVLTVPANGGVLSPNELPADSAKILSSTIQQITGTHNSNSTLLDLYVDSKTIENQVRNSPFCK